MKIVVLSLASVLFLAGCQTSSYSPGHTTLMTTSTPHSYGYDKHRVIHGYGHGYGAHSLGHGLGHSLGHGWGH